jgi:hypothetical protein
LRVERAQTRKLRGPVAISEGDLRANGESAVLTPYIVYYKYKCPGEKKPGAVKQFRIYANSWEEAKGLASRHAAYPDIEVLRVKPA